MPQHVLRTDHGPDVMVDTEQRVARVEVYCGKTGKHCGIVEIYRTPKNLVVHLQDKRRPAGHNRSALLFKRDARPAVILEAVGATAVYGVKEALRRAGIVDECVTVDSATALIED